MSKQADFVLTDLGESFRLEPVSAAAHAWANEHLKHESVIDADAYNAVVFALRYAGLRHERRVR